MAHMKALQKVIIGNPLPSLKDLYKAHCLKRARSILKNKTHPGHQVFELLPTGRRFRVLESQTNRLRNSFYSRVIALLNAKWLWFVFYPFFICILLQAPGWDVTTISLHYCKKYDCAMTIKSISSRLVLYRLVSSYLCIIWGGNFPSSKMILPHHHSSF